MLMPVFYYHPTNQIAQRLAEMTRQKGFMYTNRAELEFKLQNQLAEAGYDIWSTFHTMLGSLAGTIDKHLLQSPSALDPDNELDRHTLKLCKSSKTPWSFIKVLNGNKMSFVMGYCSTPASNPFGMSALQMAQRGIISTSHMPSAS
jgi:hypothetical protein